ncbi:phytanoyl-CoA dioxygenase family protein [Stackebrandtia soli]|uniref:phytanoyl-CoA dioxygenase family protein n=1 Tax=Stackebrandtia soli TaxID=1892856 RepID=UPI0039ED5D91
MLAPEQIEAFVRDGFVRVPAAFDARTAATCRDELWREIGYDAEDPATWVEPVVRVWHMHTEPFRAAVNTPALHAAFDALVGAGRWVPRGGVGSLPLRFPHADAAEDTGWHVDTSFADDEGRSRANLRSRERALLMLFLFTDVGEDDAPTRIRVGSHRDTARALASAGETGLEFMELAGAVADVTADHPEAYATGAAGDVYLCHPFLVHAAQDIRGTRPRFMAQPPLVPVGDFDPDAENPVPVERAIAEALRERR